MDEYTQPPIYGHADSTEPPAAMSDPLYEPSVSIAEATYRSPGRNSSGIWLLITMVLFAVSAGGGFDLVRLAILMGTLLFHEAGHYLGMQLFGYRDVRMFFIPFFGAAVSGKKHAAPAWQQLIVLLLGPLPGIVLGVILFAILRPQDFESVEFQIVSMLIGLNAFNLLPILPLDGGRIVHLLIFRRHPALELIFRVIAVAALGLMAFYGGLIVLGIVAVFLAITIPLGYRQGTRARLLSKTWPSLGAIWPNLAEADRQELFRHSRELVPGDGNPKTIAARMLSLHEAISERSPGLLATLGFSVLYLGSVVVVPVLVVVMILDVQQRQPQPQPPAPAVDQR